VFDFTGATKIYNDYRAKGAGNQFLDWANQTTLTRAYLYAMMCADIKGEINETSFSAGCNRFGLDNPVPTITKRLAHYGNNYEVEKWVEEAAQKINDLRMLDPAKFGSIHPDKAEAKERHFAEFENRTFVKPKAAEYDM